MPALNISLPCSICGKDLIGTDSAGLCPHCGGFVEATLRVHGLGEDLAVCEDVACAGCGYNLRMQPASGYCPECGRPVADSLRADDLRTADREWVVRVRSGVTILLILPVALILGGCLVPVLLDVLPGLQMGGVGPVFIVGIFLCLAVLAFLGLFRASSRDPSPAGREQPAFPYVLTRVAVFTYIGAALIQWAGSALLWGGAGSMTIAGTAPGISGLEIVTLIFSVVDAVAAVLACVGLALCLRIIFVRARQANSRRLATVLAWFAAITGVCGGLAMAALAYEMHTMISAAATSGPGTATLPAGMVVTTAPGPVTAYVTTSPGGSGIAPVGQPATTMPATPPTPFPRLFLLLPFASCAIALASVVTLILLLIVLIRARRLLTGVLAARNW